MPFLAIDVGAGAQGILLCDGSRAAENGLDLVLASPAPAGASGRSLW